MIKPHAHNLILNIPHVKGRFKLVYHQWNTPVKEAPIALCVHGLTRNGRDFDYFANELSKTHTVICPDLPGRGQSDWLTDTSDYNYDVYTHVILQLLAHFGEKSVDWIGTSLGGILGMRIAAEHPQYINKLILNDIGAVIPSEGIRRINDYVGLSMQFHGRDDAEKHLRSVYASFGLKEEAHWKHLLDHSFTKRSNGDYQLAYDPGILDPVRNETNDLLTLDDIELWPWWDVIQASTLLLRGETSDILTRKIASEMLARNAHTKLIEYTGIGHAPALMDISQINDTISFILEDTHLSSASLERTQG